MAGKSIKGLTVEIGGDTTKLGKALEDVTKKSKSMSTELGEINRLLKLDPGNTDLLAQKQKVLAEAITNTGKKLDTLKEAEKQVQAQFEKGEASEEQVRALQREIIATEKKMNSYEKAAKETEDALKGLGKETKDVEKSSSGLGKAMGDAAKTGLKAVAAAATAAVGALVGAAEATREYRAEMGKLDAAFESANLSAESASDTYKALQGVIGETDQSVEAAQQIALLADSEEDAARWAEQAAGVVGTFGDALQPETFYEAANETMKLGEATGAYVQMLEGTGMSVEEFNAGLAACSTEAEKQAYMLEVTEAALGTAGDAYREANAEIIRANEANEAWTASMAEVGGAMEPILTDIKLMGASLLSDLMPGIQGVAEAFRGMLSGDEGAADAFGASLSGILTDLLTKLTETLPTIATVAMSLLTTLTTTLITALPQLVTTGVQMVMSIINGLTLAIPQIMTALVNMIPQLVLALTMAIPQLIQGAVNLFMALVQAIPLIIPPLVAALPPLVMSVINGLLTAIPQLIEGALQFLLAIIDAIPLLIEQLIPALPLIITTVVNGLLENIPILLDAAFTLLMAIVDAIPLLIEQLLAELPAVLTTILQIIGQLPGKLWTILTDVIGKFSTLVSNIISKVKSGFTNVVSGAVSIIQGLPGKIWTYLQQAISKVTQFGTQAVNKAKTAAKNILNGIVDTLKSLPSKMGEVGKNLVEGLWNGINGVTDWVIGKIKGFGDKILDGIKGFFGIHSPSREMAWVGEMLDRGLAQGVLDNMDAPVDAMTDMADDMLGEADSLNGLTLERQLNSTFNSPEAPTMETGLLGRLDSILAAIERGQILAIDGDKLVGATAGKLDNILGQRYALAARGAI